MLSIVLLLVLLGIAAYWRANGWILALAAIAGLALGQSGVWWIGAIVVAVVAVFSCLPQARRLITDRIFGIFKKVTPAMSETEEAAINAGTVWWDGELFSGKPDFNKLLNYPDPKLTAEEQAFIDGPVEELCRMLNDWDITHSRKDLPPEAWQFIKDNGFLGMIVKKKYGGLEFSNYAHAKVVMKIGTRSGSAAVTVMVPNS